MAVGCNCCCQWPGRRLWWLLMRLGSWCLSIRGCWFGRVAAAWSSNGWYIECTVYTRTCFTVQSVFSPRICDWHLKFDLLDEISLCASSRHFHSYFVVFLSPYIGSVTDCGFGKRFLGLFFLLEWFSASAYCSLNVLGVLLAYNYSLLFLSIDLNSLLRSAYFGSTILSRHTCFIFFSIWCQTKL